MIKTLSNIFKQDKEKFVIPRSVQQVIPIETIWSEGIFKIGRNKFARTYKFTDINYAVASKVDKETMFLEYMDLLNSFDCGGTTKITINNRRLNKVDFEKAILIPMQEDGLDLYRKEYNNMLLDKATSSNSMVRNVVMGLWVMALLISSSIICTTNMSPKICGIPAIGAIGYLFAFAIVMYVLIKHILSK